jgi:hypothetical protein
VRSDVSFDPRLAALNYGAKAMRDNSELGNVVACGLVYIGDQLARSNLLAEYKALGERSRNSTFTTAKVTDRLRSLERELWPDEEAAG